MDRATLRARDADIRDSRLPTGELAARYGLTSSHVSRIRAGTAAGLTRKERFQVEVLNGGWQAACMDQDEWDHWVATNPAIADGSFADRPCTDCPLGFAAEMREAGRCNGQPGGVGSDEEDEGDMQAAEQGVIQEVRVALTLPCLACSHEPVCGLKKALERVAEVDVTMSRLPDGLGVELKGTATCRFFDKARGRGIVRGDAAQTGWTPERRAAQADRIREANARKRAEA